MLIILKEVSISKQICFMLLAHLGCVYLCFPLYFVLFVCLKR